MAVFISYSSRDRALVEGLLTALRRARQPAWLDEELTGGEAWWRTILEQIRDCEVFIVALSKNMLESKACQAELRYAQALDKAILPVQIGPLDNLRINPLAHMQVIDYRNPSIETGIELVSTVQTRRTTAKPLPDPLPDEPPIPFAYLMRLASTITGPSLTAQEQTTLVAELKAGLEEDGDDASARRDITQLLCMLRDRNDVTYRTRTEVESVLASLQPPPTSAPPPPPPPATGPQPRYQPPPSGPPPPGFNQHWTQPPSGPPGFGVATTGPGSTGKPSKSTTKWLIAGGTAAAALVAIIVIAAVIIKPDPTPQQVPTVDDAGLDAVLLAADEIHAIVGRSDLIATAVLTDMDDTSLTISEPDCTGVMGTALESVYAGSGQTSVRDQAFTHEDPRVFIAQTAVLFPSADRSQTFMSALADKWSRCVGKSVSIASPNGEERWTVDKVARSDSQVTQTATAEASAGYGCQHALRVVSNVILEAAACHDDVSDEADQIVEKLAANIPK